jgi:predicted alpha/beta-hydrolase family hydrolase
VAIRRAAVAARWQAVLVEQPWRVAGKRVAPAPARLDVAWIAILAQLQRAVPLRSAPLIVGGRSAGARVACRTAATVGAQAVCCLAFPLHPPGRPERSRAAELSSVRVPVLVVQGLRDPFGGPDDLTALGLAGVEVVAVPGDHSFGKSAPAVAEAVRAQLQRWEKSLRNDPLPGRVVGP